MLSGDSYSPINQQMRRVKRFGGMGTPEIEFLEQRKGRRFADRIF